VLAVLIAVALCGNSMGGELAPIVRIIPERTIDAWTSSAILVREPRALIWAPTSPGQPTAGSQPWHFAIAAFDPPGKLLVLANKALLGRAAPHHFPKVSVELGQLARLVDLELEGLPILYGLPCLYDGEVSGPEPHEGLSAHALLRLKTQFDRWLRIVRPLELLAVRPVMKAVAASRHRMTLSTLSLVGFPPLRELLSSIGTAPWGKYLPGNPESRTWPLLPLLRPDAVVKDAVRQAASMGEATASEMDRRLNTIFEQTRVRPRRDESWAPPRVDMHLARTIWIVLPAPQRPPEGQAIPVGALVSG
jgi:hypothetical protein